LRLVFLAIFFGYIPTTSPNPEKNMALMQAAVGFLFVFAFALGAASLGNLVLCKFGPEMDTDAEHLLASAGLGVICFEVLLFGAEALQQARYGGFAVAGLLCIALLVQGKSVLPRCIRLWRAAVSSVGVDRFLVILIGIVIGAEFLASMAPLTGSDALHYHFTTQKLILEYGFHPDFSISHSFLCGQHHLLILFGLAIGGEKLAMGLIFLGGVLTALALVSFVSRYASQTLALSTSLLFLLTPIVFWQASSSGAPDIWMAFFVCVALIVLNQEKCKQDWRHALLVGLLAGGVAGAKYSGTIVAASIAAAFLIECRNVMNTLVFGVGSLLAGIWPYLRNLIWTGDPVFPFLTKFLNLDKVNSAALGRLLVDTGASLPRHVDQLVPFLFFAGSRKGAPGLWDFFGPFIFAMAPLFICAIGNFRNWRAPAIVWLLSGLVIFWSSGLQRFMLTVFPLGLFCTALWIYSSRQMGWKITSTLATCLLAFFCVMGLAGLGFYIKEPLAASLGVISQERYLQERRPEYQKIEVINKVLGDRAGEGKTLLFLRHLYPLNVPYVNGDPDTSWLADPNRLRTPGDWMQFFEQHGIKFVVRSPDYPESIAPPLRELEANGDLVPLAESMVQDFQAKRMQGTRIEVPVRIFSIRNSASK
jgi:hypothetical protein